MISNAQRIEIVDNFNDSMEYLYTYAEMVSIVDRAVDGDLEEFLPEELQGQEDANLDEEIGVILEPVVAIWVKNRKEVFAKYKGLKVTDYVDKFTFDTKKNLKQRYDEISEEVGRNPEEEAKEDEEDGNGLWIDNEESATWNIYNEFIASQVKHDFNNKIKDYIAELKVPKLKEWDNDYMVDDDFFLYDQKDRTKKIGKVVGLDNPDGHYNPDADGYWDLEFFDA